MRNGASRYFSAILVLLSMAACLTSPQLRGDQNTYTAWSDTDDHRGIQYRYQVINPNLRNASCFLQFRDLEPESKKSNASLKGDTDVEFHYNFVMPGGGEADNRGSTRIWNQTDNYGNHNIDLCIRLTSVVVGKLERGL